MNSAEAEAFRVLETLTMSVNLSRSIASLGAAVLAGALSLTALPATAQVYGYPSGGYQPGGSQDFYGYQRGVVCGDRCGDHREGRRYDRSYQGQVDQPGDYRCDAYWDRGRSDCDAGWRDQRAPWQRSSGRRYAPAYNGPAVYYGDYGRPDVVYSSAYEHNGHDHREYGQGGRSQQRINWCCAEYRSYDPATGYYIAYSGQPVFCG